MSREKLINAFNLLAEAAAQVAIELEASDSAGAGSAPSTPAPAHRPAAVPAAPSGYTHCPKHGREFKPSKNPEWGAFCTATSDDPAWSNDKGYCRITSKNAGEWVAVHGGPA